MIYNQLRSTACEDARSVVADDSWEWTALVAHVLPRDYAKRISFKIVHQFISFYVVLLMKKSTNKQSETNNPAARVLTYLPGIQNFDISKITKQVGNTFCLLGLFNQRA